MKFALHPHQADALAKLRASLLAGARRPMVQAPTGAGKTVIAATIIEGALAKQKRVLFVAPFLSLIDQTVEAFAAQGIASVGVMQGYHPLTDATQPVQVCSMQTLQRRRLPKADLVIIDEAHRWYDFLGKWMAMPEWQKVPFIGLSATPWTKGLGKRYDDLIVAATTADLITKGFLSPFKVYAPSHPDLTKVRTTAGDYNEGDLADVMSQPTLIGDIVATWLRLAEDRPTLVFAVDRAHARKLADEFEAAGVPCGYVDALTERGERERIGHASNRTQKGRSNSLIHRIRLSENRFRFSGRCCRTHALHAAAGRSRRRASFGRRENRSNIPTHGTGHSGKSVSIRAGAVRAQTACQRRFPGAAARGHEAATPIAGNGDTIAIDPRRRISAPELQYLTNSHSSRVLDALGSSQVLPPRFATVVSTSNRAASLAMGQVLEGSSQ